MGKEEILGMVAGGDLCVVQGDPATYKTCKGLEKQGKITIHGRERGDGLVWGNIMIQGVS